MPRLFSGLSLPDEIRGHLATLMGELDGAHWMDPDDYHLTLRFMGDVDGRVAEEIAANLADIAQPVFELSLGGLGAFGGERPRALWVDVAASPALAALRRAHDRAARHAGLPPEERKFVPHVTLARLHGTRPDHLAHYLGANAGFRAAPFVVEEFCLFSARPGTGGGPYAVEERYALIGASVDWP